MTALQDEDAVPSVSVVSTTSMRNGVSVSSGNRNSYLQVTGVLPAVTQIRNYRVDSGRFIDDQDIADMASTFSMELAFLSASKVSNDIVIGLRKSFAVYCVEVATCLSTAPTDYGKGIMRLLMPGETDRKYAGV